MFVLGDGQVDVTLLVQSAQSLHQTHFPCSYFGIMFQSARISLEKENMQLIHIPSSLHKVIAESSLFTLPGDLAKEPSRGGGGIGLASKGSGLAAPFSEAGRPFFPLCPFPVPR
ncbi:MAG: hypothetical protein OXD30_07465, partial [Bryobacterales bacterium]|nr:hypothetical protein [Bryobacterales bacterium]